MVEPHKPSPRDTQVLERPISAATPISASIASVIKLIEQGEEPRRIYQTIAECAAQTPGVQDVVISLPLDRVESAQEIVARAGAKKLELDLSLLDRSNRSTLQSATSTFHHSSSGSYNFFDVICLGAPIGALIVDCEQGLGTSECEKLSTLAHHTSVVFERQRLSNTVQLFLDRLEVLNELNQLIASNVGLQRIVKSIARESAFRFASDVSLAFLLDEDKMHLEVKGGYGCTPDRIPKKIDLNAGLLAQVMRVGGHLSVPNINQNDQTHGLKFVADLGIKAVNLFCLEVRGEALGALVIGFRREYSLSQNDLTRFEEFCQGAAVAIANARSQERITSYTERLEELVESRTADLAIQTARAEEANQAKSQFLANMSHELRTPLTAIVGYSSVLADGVFGPLNEKQLDALNAVTKSSEHLKNLIDDVLNLARVESGKEDPEPVAVSVKDLLNQAHKLMLQTAIGKGVALQPLALGEDMNVVNVWADSKHLHQIIINLMSNGVKYTPRGGKVWVKAEVVVDKVKISVQDTGVGISPHKLSKLFERFERGEDTYSKSQEGTGIGLNLTRTLVELNGGRIGVESKEGQGSTFWILLPLAEHQAIQVVQQDNGVSRPRLDGLTTLVVDDNKDTCEVLRQILISAGAQVRVANTVKEGIGVLNEAPPDIVLTDLAIPGESGLVLIEHIRNTTGPQGQLPIIVLSACAFQADKDAALNAGASMFIPKPFRPNEIIKNVRQLTLNMAMQ